MSGRLRTLRYGPEHGHGGMKREDTIAFTFGPWGGIWFKGNRYCARLCIGFVAVTYVRLEMTELIDVYLHSSRARFPGQHRRSDMPSLDDRPSDEAMTRGLL